ncbi:MAG: FAD-dependent oxidoreductase [Gammaproteobacteria bacterium]|nr:FAD-dependent oxidoreductase [Gammaproteobacteria bacterium]
MASTQHYVIIGNGVAGNEAASCLRQRDPDSRITIITAGRLLFYSRYELPRLFHETCDWRDFLVNPVEYYVEKRINVRRNSFVTHVDANRKTLNLAHKEEITYSQLLVASGGASYLPADLNDFAPLLNRFNLYSAACKVRDILPKKGKVVMLGGDVLGLDLARNLVNEGYQVVLVATEHTFWPHRVDQDERTLFLGALRDMGVEVIEDAKIDQIQQGAPGMSARHILFDDGREIFADVVMPFLGLSPAADFMMGSGVDFERGLLVSTNLQTTDPNIWAAGDVCQIWSPEEKQYRFYYGWKNVKKMGEIAARNMTGDDIRWETATDQKLFLDDNKQIVSPYWEHD